MDAPPRLPPPQAQTCGTGPLAFPGCSFPSPDSSEPGAAPLPLQPQGVAQLLFPSPSLPCGTPIGWGQAALVLSQVGPVWGGAGQTDSGGRAAK